MSDYLRKDVMKPTAKKIREELRSIGYSSRDVSVRCTPGYKIFVKTRKDTVDFDKVKAAARKAYHADSHSWLCVCVNTHWLPMPPRTENRQ